MFITCEFSRAPSKMKCFTIIAAPESYQITVIIVYDTWVISRAGDILDLSKGHLLKSWGDFHLRSLSNKFLLQDQVLTPVTLATWEAEIGRIEVWGQYRQVVHKTSISKITTAKWTRGVSQAIELLLCKWDALSSNLSPTKTKNFPHRLYILIAVFGKYVLKYTHFKN
jgi:hypothetical protein